MRILSMIHPAKTPQPNGFDLATFAPSLDAEAGESLAAFLQNFEDPMPIGAGCHCKKHNLIYAEGGECYGCLQEERDELRAELVHSNKFLEDAKAAFKAKTDTLEARVAELEAANSYLRSTLLNCAAHAGLPDPATGCRAIIATVKDALLIP